MNTSNIFQDLIIVEFASVLAGPLVGTFFAELGAKVIKIENPKTGGDVTRSWKLPSEKADAISAYYASCNYRKEVYFLDLKDDREKIIPLIEKADILIHNFKFGDAAKFNFEYESVRKINPTIIYASINGFGEDSKRVAYDVVLQAETGFMHMNGTPASDPVKMPVALVDVLCAHQLKEAVLVALWKRAKTGEGSKVSCSLYDAAVGSLVNQASNWLNAGHIAQRMGSLHPNIAPYGEQYLCADGKKVVLAVGSDRQFKNLLGILNLSELVDDEKYSANKSRVKNRTELSNYLAEKIATFKRADFITHCIEKNVPAGAIRDMQEVFSQKAAQDLILTEGETKRVRTTAFHIT